MSPRHCPENHYRLRRQQGAALMVMLVILIMGAAAILVNSLSNSGRRIERDKITADALAQAKEALIGFAITYGDTHIGQGYGYLPLPDLGSSRNNNFSLEEGNAAANFSGNTKNLTVIGRLPWRKLGLSPLRDSQGECLWYAVSGSFQNNQKADVLNWDSLGHFDAYSSNGTASGTISSVGANYAQRPVAIIFSASAALQGQNHQASTTDTVSICGGNYDVHNYLDSFNADTNINNIVNYFTSSTNNSTGYAYNLINTSNGSQLDTIALSAPKKIIFGDIEVNGEKIVNDKILIITADDIFSPIIRRSDFSQQITTLMNDLQSAGAINCSLATDPTFCNNWKEMLLLTQLPAGPSNITIDGTLYTTCTRVLIFGGQKTAAQIRLTSADKTDPANYLEGANLAAFATPIANSSNFTGSSAFDANNPGKDLLRCIL